jgi:hypothetical protein
MLSRMGALALAAIVAGAPMSVTACEMLCATRAGQGLLDDAAASAHSCHDAQSGGTPGAISGQDHVCGHREELPVSSGVQGASSVSFPSMVTLASTPTLHAGIVLLEHIVTKSPPAHPVSRVSLRI